MQLEAYGCVRKGVALCLRVADVVSLSKLLHQAIDLLRFPRQPEVQKEHADGVVKLEARKVHRINVRMHHLHATGAMPLGILSKY